MSDDSAAIRSCIASCTAWRRQAAHLREHADRPHLRTEQREVLLRGAIAADRQADWWLAGVAGYAGPTIQSTPRDEGP